MKLASLAAMTALVLAACAADESLPQRAPEPRPAEGLGATVQAATVSVPVTVVNGANEPVPTTVKGTAQVAGTVGLAAGTSVSVANAVTLGGQSTVGLDPARNGVQVLSMPAIVGDVTCAQAAGEAFDVNVTGTPDVRVVSMPQVALAGTPDVRVVSMPQVALAGTPTVNVANFPASQGGGLTTLIFQNVFNISPLDFVAAGEVDVSAYREVRVIVNAFGAVDYKLQVLIADDSGLGRDLILDLDIVEPNMGSGSRVYTMPGKRLKFVAFGPNNGASIVGISVYGRG